MKGSRQLPAFTALLTVAGLCCLCSGSKTPAASTRPSSSTFAAELDAAIPRLLEKHRVALCAVSHPALPPDVVPTTDFLYVRFHGLGEKLYDYEYSPKQLAEWAARLRPHLGRREVYAFFNNDWHCQAIRNAKSFRKLLAGTGERPGVVPAGRTRAAGARLRVHS